MTGRIHYRVLSIRVRKGYLVAGAKFYREKTLPHRMLSTRVRTGYLVAGAEFERKNPHCQDTERKSEDR